MGAKIAASFLTFIVMVLAAMAGFIALIVALDGQSESNAGYGMAAYGILVFLTACTMAVLAFVLVHFLLKREFKGWKAAVTAIVTFSILGIISIFVCIVIGVGIAEYLRINY